MGNYMKLEKNKIYKILHDPRIGMSKHYSRHYIICSPLEDVDLEYLPHESILGGRFKTFDCNFLINFMGELMYDNISTAYWDSCKILPLNTKDLLEIKQEIKTMGKIYNRKLNKFIDND